MAETAAGASSEGRLLVRAARIGAALVFVVIVTSAFLRLVRSGVGCEDWPHCYGMPLAAAAPAVARWVPWTQLTHLLAAAGVGVLVLLTVALSLQKPWRRETILVALVLATVTLFLSVLGRAAPGSQLPAVALGNVLGGLASLALFWWLGLRRVASPPVAVRWHTIAAAVALALLAVQVALGTILSASFAARACAGLAECGVAPTAWDFSAFNPWRAPAAPAAAAGADLARITLHAAHRWSGVIVAGYLLVLAGVFWRSRGVVGRRIATALAVLPLVQFGLGIVLVRWEVPLAAAVSHSGVTALLVMTVVSALYYSKSADAASVSAACQTVTSK